MNEAQNPAQGDAVGQRVLNPDGTTNWTVVFEDPEQGILAAVSETSSARQLRAVMSNVALLLFKRKRDAGPRAEFTASIENVLDTEATQGFEAVQARILGILNAEKQLRTEKAALHAKNKATTQSIEKRRSSANESAFEAFIGNPLFLGGAVAVVLGLIAVVVGLVILPAGTPDENEAASKDAAKQAEQGTEPASDQASAKAPPKPTPNKPTKERIVLKPILSEVLVDGTRRRLSVIPLIEIGKKDKIGEICALSPWIIEGVLLHMGAATEAGRNANNAVIAGVAAKVSADINARPGSIKIKGLTLADIRQLPKDIVVAANRGCGRVQIEELP